MSILRFLIGCAVPATLVITSCSEDEDTCTGSSGQCFVIKVGADAQTQVQRAFIDAKPGDTVQFGEGTFDFTQGFSLNTSQITVRGRGMEKTILSFRAQDSGAEGILAKGDHLVFEDFSILDTKGDALKVEGANGVTFRRVKAEWTGGPLATNGAYGLYPVQCQNVLIEDSAAVGASDAGIYVGQSKNIIVRRNKAEQNVAGIEIENSQFADVYENEATGNSGGILVFDLPGLPVKDGGNIRVFNNRSIRNNTSNFAPAGNIVALVPKGTGLMVMANNGIEIFGNTVEGNGTTGLAIVSYFITDLEIKDDAYDPYPEAIHVHDNSFSGNGGSPDLRGNLGLLGIVVGKPIPDVVYDGIVDSAKKVDGSLPADLKVCIRNNGSAGFVNVDAENLLSGTANISRDLAPHDCDHTALPAVSLPGGA